VRKVALSPGVHVITCENAEQGLKKSWSVTIKSGEATNKRFDLQ
jgi:hypothetical protein